MCLNAYGLTHHTNVYQRCECSTINEQKSIHALLSHNINYKIYYD